MVTPSSGRSAISSASERSTARDGRLLVPALALWLGAFVAVTRVDAAPDEVTAVDWAHGCAVLSAWGIGLLALGGVTATLLQRRLGQRLAPPGWLLIAVLFVAIGAGRAALWPLLGVQEPLAGWIDQRATGVVDGTVVGEARTRRPAAVPAFGPTSWQEVAVSAHQLSARGLTLQGSWPFVVRLPLGVRAPPPGSTVRVVGRWGRVPLRTGRLGRLTVARTGVEVSQPPGLLDAAAQSMRDGLREALSPRDPDAAALVAGLAIGDEGRQSVTLHDAMRASGLAHLTAVSGGNVAIVLGAVLLLARWARVPLWVRVVLGLAALGYFVILVGPEPSVLRASVMGAIVVGALLTGGRRGGPSILATGVIVLLLAQPWLAVSWGFALSVAATAGLILVAPRLQHWTAGQRWANLVGPVVRDAAALTVAAQVATLPILVAMGGAVGWVSVPANLAAMPVVPAITMLGLGAAGLAPLLPALAGVLAWLASWPALWIARVATTAPALPLSAFPWPEGWTGVLLLALAGLGVVGGWRVIRRLPRWGRRIVAIALSTTIVMTHLQPPGARGWPPDGWIVLMCDVGQGDLLAVRSGPASALVVDAGPDPEAADDCLRAAGIDAIPLLVLTHFHADHVGGLAGVLRRRSVGRVVVSPVAEPADASEVALRLLAEARVPVDVGWAGDVWEFSRIRIRALAPRRVIDSGSRVNNASVVLEVEVAHRRVLLTGDVETEAQVAIAADLGGRPFDVVKVPHHGSARQSVDLPRWAPAAVALISVGADNDYGQPAEQTVAAWRSAGAVVVRSDQAGTVAVVAASPEGAMSVVTR